MSIKCMNYVWTQSITEGTARLMLLALADSCNDDGEWSPGVTRLAAKCNMSERQAQRLLHQLEELGEIEIAYNKGVKTSHGFTNHYCMKRFQMLDGVTSMTPRQPDGVTSMTPQGVTRVSPNTSVNTSVNIQQPQETEFVFTNQEDPNDALLSPSQPSSVVGKREGPTPLPPAPQRKEKARTKVQGDPASAAAWEMYLAKIEEYERGTSLNFGRERKAINALVKRGWTAEKIGECFDRMKADDWWADKHLPAQSISQQIGAKLNGKATSSRNGERNFSLALAFGEES